MSKPAISLFLVAATLLSATALGSDALPSVSPVPATTTSAALPVLRVAVYNFSRSDVDEHVSTVLTIALTNELRKLDRVSVIGMDEVRTMLDLEAQKQLAGCAADSCLSEIAEALGADVVVTGSLARVGDNTYFAIKKIEQRTATVAGQFTRKLNAAGGEEFLAMVGPSVAELFAERALRAGQVRGVPKSIAARLVPPPVAPWMFWTGVVASGLGAAATATSALVLADRYLAFDTLRKGSSAKGGDVLEARSSAESWALTAAVAGGITGAATLVTGVSFFFVDWGDELDDG